MNNSSAVLVEPLTRRERIILLHLVENKSNQEIAVIETLALTSVKWYIQQIYAKLGVNRRSAVVERAYELGLLKTAPGPSPVPANTKNNLPAQLTSFIGREREITELRLRIKKNATRLLTLTGSGGTGKSRLALQVAGGLLDVFPDGVWLVELAPLADPLLVPQMIITALGLVEQPDKTTIAFLIDYLREKKLLLILDNCEHLVDACAELTERLLQSASRLTVLVTSREILGVSGEIARVPPLGIPDLYRRPPLGEVALFDAVRLFVDRARLVDPAFVISEENADALAQITQRLDGIPLALELAAARLNLLSVEQIASRLDDAFGLLTRGSRTALPRHQTLQALIDWSYNLLTEAERRLLRGLSVFAGGWTLEAAEEVSSEIQDILDLLSQLADKSLILVVSTPGGEKRYRMLETIRQYAHARLVETGEAAAVRGRHLSYYLRLGERLEPRLRSWEQIMTLDELGRELDNLRLALIWALQADVEGGLRLASALLWFWQIRYHWAEGMVWLKQGLEAESFSRGSRPPEGRRALIRAKALTALGLHILARDDPVLGRDDSVSAKPFFEEALNLFRASESDQHRGLAWVQMILGRFKFVEGNSAQGKLLAQEALSRFRDSGDSHGMAECLHLLGDWEINPLKKKEFYLEMLSIEQANGDIEGTANSLLVLGVYAVRDGDYAEAFARFAEGRECSRRVGNPLMVAYEGMVLAFISQFNGDPERATLFNEEALSAYREIVNDGQVAYCLFWKSMYAFAQGGYEQVAGFSEEVQGIAQKTGIHDLLTLVFYLRARMARLQGEPEKARLQAKAGLNAGPDLEESKMWVLMELASLSLQDGDLAHAEAFSHKGLEILIHVNKTPWLGFLLDLLAVLSERQGRLERAALLFGTRQWRGVSHILSPVEYTQRQTDLTEIEAALGSERFAKLQKEGLAMNFNQVLALTQAEV